MCSSLLAIDIPFLTFRLLAGLAFGTTASGLNVSYQSFWLKNVLCIIIQSLDLRVAQEAEMQIALRINTGRISKMKTNLENDFQIWNSKSPICFPFFMQ